MAHTNVLVFGIDSVRANALSVYGNTHCLTPHVDRIAEKGATVSHCFAQMPKCIPNRSTMLMGRYPHVHGMRVLTGVSDPEASSRHCVITPKTPSILPLLKAAGYTLCHKGCNHLVDWEAYPLWFDVGMDWDCRSFRECVPPPRTCEDEKLGRALYAGPVPEDYDPDRSSDAEATRQMAAFIEEHDGRRPFFAYLDLRTPHPLYRYWPIYRAHYDSLALEPPVRVPLEQAPWTERVYRQTYDLEDMPAESWTRILRAYYSAISYADMLVGRVMQALERRALDGNTLVVFTSDHGDFAGEHGCVEKHDPFLYDSMTRLPFLAQLPGRIPPGRRAEALMEQVDLAPTILEACGLEIPRWMQGRSLLSLLAGTTDTHRDAVGAQGGVEREVIDRRSLVGEEHFYKGARSWRDSSTFSKQRVILEHPDFMMRARMIRTLRHKYIHRLNGHHEFYDCVIDPGELHNRIDDPACAPAIQEMRSRLLDWMLSAETNLPLLDQAYA